jgi:glycosyltransferase involved in cell wall biosynthesis
MHRRKPKILLINIEDMGIGTSGLLAAEALSRNPDLDVRFIYDQGLTRSALLRARLAKLSGMKVNARSRRNLPLAHLQILYFCLKFRPDVVHDLGGSGFRKNLPLWLVLSVMSRLVFSDHAPSRKRLPHFFNRVARRCSYRLGEKFIVFGPDSRAAVLHCGVAEWKIFQSRLGHKGFYAEAVRHTPPRDPNTILFFGEFREGKGLDWLPAIAETVHARCPAARFLVAGSSQWARYCGASWPEQLGAHLDAMRARPYFKVRDEFIPEENVAEFFLSAGMILLPYREANQSGVLLTAMALECPVVAAAVGDIPSVIRHGENGMLCAPNPAAFADAIVALLQNPRRATELAARARQDAENSFAWENIVREYPENVYGL